MECALKGGNEHNTRRHCAPARGLSESTRLCLQQCSGVQGSNFREFVVSSWRFTGLSAIGLRLAPLITTAL